MTKRFKGFYVENKGWGISDTNTKIDWLIETKGDLVEFLKMLNELYEDLIFCHSYLSSKTTVENANAELRKENEQLKQQMKKLESQLYCPYDSICIQCNNEYLVQKKEYYVSKCKKGHEQCSKVDVKYCDDFELKGDVE